MSWISLTFRGRPEIFANCKISKSLLLEGEISYEDQSRIVSMTERCRRLHRRQVSYLYTFRGKKGNSTLSNSFIRLFMYTTIENNHACKHNDLPSRTHKQCAKWYQILNRTSTSSPKTTTSPPPPQTKQLNPAHYSTRAPPSHHHEPPATDSPDWA